MKNRVCSLILLLMTFTTAAFAQKEQRIYEQLVKEQAEYRAAMEEAMKSPAAMELRDKVSHGNVESILEAAKSGDKSLIPYFRLLSRTAGGRSQSNSEGFMAHVALLRFEDETAFNEVLTDIKSTDPIVQDGAIKRLAVAGTKAAFRKLYELLDDTKQREPDPPVAFDVVYEPNNAVVAMYELALVVPNPPVKKYATEKDIPKWKEWFEKNKHLIE